MSDLYECVPNFSEGRNLATVESIRTALAESGATVLDVQADPDHNRSVFTIIGTDQDLISALIAAMEIAVGSIDLRTHTGAHPRSGAMDVVPFIPLLSTSMESAVDLSKRFGQTISDRFGLPVYFYEDSATTPARRNLAIIRGKGFEEMAARITTPEWRPDIGPAAVHPTAGAVITGARRPLIAYNIYLGTDNLEVAKSIAKQIRHTTGGLRYVKALGFDIPERSCVQVSMNLTNYKHSALHTVFEMVRVAASAYGVSITESEIVGMAPVSAFIDAGRHFLRMHSFREDQALELRLLELQSTNTAADG